MGSNSAPDFVDLDGDGDLDAVVGERYGTLRYFTNAGSSSAPAFLELTGTANPFDGVDGASSSSPVLADLDADGDLDAVVGTLDSGVRYFANTGCSSAPAFLERSNGDNPFGGTDVGFRSTPELIDIDSDGDLDAVFGKVYGRLLYFANTGSSSTPIFLRSTGTANPFDGLVVGWNSRPRLVDLDGDGDLDLVVGADGGTLSYFANIGTSSTPVFLAVTGADSPFSGIDVGSYSSPNLVDLDGDSDLDAVVGEVYGSLSYFANTGSSLVPAFLEINGSANPIGGIDVGFLSSPNLVDLDADGDLDAVVGEYDGGLSFFSNTGSTSVPCFLRLFDTDNPFNAIDVGNWSSPELVDIDGDGDLDAVVGEYDGGLRYFTNTGGPSSPAFLERTGDASPFNGIDVGLNSSPSLADLDSDSDLDAVIGAYGGTLHYFVNTGSSSVPAFVEIMGTTNPFDGINVGASSSPELLDLDDDGDLDAAVGERSGRLRYFVNTGSSSVPAFEEAAGTSNPFDRVGVGSRSSPDLVDIDGDADLDVILGETGGRIVFFRSLAAEIFQDGFESGDTSLWSASVPP